MGHARYSCRVQKSARAARSGVDRCALREDVQYPALRKTVPLPAGIDGVLFDRAKLTGLAGRIARVRVGQSKPDFRALREQGGTTPLSCCPKEYT